MKAKEFKTLTYINLPLVLTLNSDKVLLHIQILHSDTFWMYLFAQLQSAFLHNNVMLLDEKYLSNTNCYV